eukprot:jgi/Ulvmu1/9593/UM054_0023.1
MTSRNHDMFGILGEGEEGSQQDPHRSFKTTAGRLSTHVVKRGNSLEPLDKWRGRSSSVPAHWDSSQPLPSGTQPADLSASTVAREDRHALPAEMMYGHILQLEERLAAGAQEVAQLRLQNSTVNREISAAQSQIQLLTEDMRSLQQAQTNSLSVRAHDSQSLAVLQHTFQTQHNTLLADISATSSKAMTTQQESKQVQASLQALLQQLQASVASGKVSLEQAHRAIADELTMLAGKVDREAVAVGTLQRSEYEVKRDVSELASMLQTEQRQRADEAAAFNRQIGAVREQAEAQIRRVREEAVASVESKARDLERMHEQVVRDLRRVDEQNRRELHMSDQFLASMQASDKETYLARFVAVERALKDSIQQQLAAERSLDGKVAAHTAALKRLVARAEERARGGECVLREQVEAAMVRLRAYAREVEEALDQAGTRLEGVVKAEIQARMESVRVLRAEGAQQAAAMTAGFARADQKVGALLDTQRLLHSRHEALQAAHEAAVRDGASREAALRAQMEQDAAACRNRIEREVAAVQLDVAEKAKAVENLCKESVQDLQEDTQVKLTQSWEAMTERADACDARVAETRDELLQADSSLMALLKDVGDAVERLELQDVAELGARLEEVQSAAEAGLAAAEEALEERVGELREEMRDADGATGARLDAVAEDAKAVGSACSGLHVRVDKLRDELLGLVEGEAALREDTLAVLRSTLDSGLTAERGAATGARAALRGEVEAELQRAQQAAEAARCDAAAAAAAEREAAEAAAAALRGHVEAAAAAAAAAVVELRGEVQEELQGVREGAVAAREEVDAVLAAQRVAAAAAVAELDARVAAQVQGALEAVDKAQEEVSRAMEEERKVAEAAREELKAEVAEVQEVAASGTDGCKAELMDAMNKASEAAAEMGAELEAAIAACATQADLDSVRTDVSALQQTAQALADAEEAQAEAVGAQLDEQAAALDLLSEAHEQLKTSTGSTADKFDGDIKKLEGALSEHASRLQSVQNDTEGQVKELQDRVRATEQGGAAQQSAIEALEKATGSLEEAVHKKLEEEHVAGLRLAMDEVKEAAGTLASAEQLNTAQAQLEALQASSDETKSRLNAADNVMKGMKEALDGQADGITALTERVEELHAARQAAESQTATADGRIVEMEASLGYNRNQMEALRTSITEVKDELAEKASSGPFDQLREDVATLSEQAKNFAAMEDVQRLEGALKAVQGELDGTVEKLTAADKAAASEAALARSEVQQIQEEQLQLRTGTEQRVSQLEAQCKALEANATTAALSGSSQVNDLEAQLKELKADCATAADVQTLQDGLAKKADLAVVDQITGGSAQELQGLDNKLQALEKAAGATAEAVRAVQSTVASKADASEVVVMKAQAEERATEAAANVSRIDASLQELAADSARVLELAAQAATATDLKAVSDAMDEMKANIPNREEMEKVVKQIADLKDNGLSALDDVGSLKSDLASLQDRLAKVESLSNSFEDLKTDVTKTQQDVKALELSVDDSAKAVTAVESRITALEANVKALVDVQAKVKQLDNTATKMREDVDALSKLELQMATAKQHAAASSAGDANVLSDLRIRIDTIDKSLAGMQTLARGEAEAVMEALRGNLQTQLDALKQQSDKSDEQQAQRLEDLQEALGSSAERVAKLESEQEQKRQQLESSLKKLIQQVASAPVEINLSDDAKKAMTSDLEQRLAVLEAKA